MASARDEIERELDAEEQLQKRIRDLEEKQRQLEKQLKRAALVAKKLKEDKVRILQEKKEIEEAAAASQDDLSGTEDELTEDEVPSDAPPDEQPAPAPDTDAEPEDAQDVGQEDTAGDAPQGAVTDADTKDQQAIPAAEVTDEQPDADAPTTQPGPSEAKEEEEQAKQKADAEEEEEEEKSMLGPDGSDDDEPDFGAAAPTGASVKFVEPEKEVEDEDVNDEDIDPDAFVDDLKAQEEKMAKKQAAASADFYDKQITKKKDEREARLLAQQAMEEVEDDEEDVYSTSEDEAQDGHLIYDPAMDKEHRAHRDHIARNAHLLTHTMQSDKKAAVELMADVDPDLESSSSVDFHASYQFLCYPYADRWLPFPSKKLLNKSLTRLDWNSFNPFESFEDYYLPYWSVFGVLLTLGTIALIVLYSMFAITDLNQDDRLQEDLFYPTLGYTSNGDKKLGWGFSSLPPESTAMSMVLADHSVLNDTSFFKVKWFNVTRTYSIDGNGGLTFVSDVEAPIATYHCTVGNFAGVCPQDAQPFSDDRNGTTAVQTFSRVKLEECIGLNTDLDAASICQDVYPSEGNKAVPCDPFVNASCHQIQSKICNYEVLVPPNATDGSGPSSAPGNFTCTTYPVNCSADSVGSTQDCFECVDMIAYVNLTTSLNTTFAYAYFTRFNDSVASEFYNASFAFGNCSQFGFEADGSIHVPEVCRLNPATGLYCELKRPADGTLCIRTEQSGFVNMSDYFGTQTPPTNRICLTEESCAFPQDLGNGQANCTLETKCETPCVNQAYQEETYKNAEFVLSGQLPVESSFSQLLLNKNPQFTFLRSWPYRSSPVQVFAEALYQKRSHLLVSRTVRKDISIDYLQFDRTRNFERRNRTGGIMFSMDLKLTDEALEQKYVGQTSLDTASAIGGMVMLTKVLITVVSVYFVKRTFMQTRKFGVNPGLVKTLLRMKHEELDYYKEKLTDLRANDVMRISMDEMFIYLNQRRDSELSTFRHCLFKALHIKKAKGKQNAHVTEEDHAEYDLPEHLTEARRDTLQELVRTDELQRAEDPEIARIVSRLTYEELSRQKDVLGDFVAAVQREFDNS